MFFPNHVRRVVAKNFFSSRAECLNRTLSVDRNDTNGTGFDNLRYSLFTELEIALNFLQVFILLEELSFITLDRGDIRDDPDKSSPTDWRRSDLYRSASRRVEDSV